VKIQLSEVPETGIEYCLEFSSTNSILEVKLIGLSEMNVISSLNFLLVIFIFLPSGQNTFNCIEPISYRKVGFTLKFSYPSLKTLNDLFNKFTHFDIILSGTVGRIISLLSNVILGKIPSPINLIFI
jgi:hypothetical protein